MARADHANYKKKDEAVNCSHKGRLWNDVHVALAKTQNADACTSINAQISPHSDRTTGRRMR